MSLSKRESFPTVMEQVAVAPGPGAYYSPPSTGVETNKGGASLQSKVTQTHTQRRTLNVAHSKIPIHILTLSQTHTYMYTDTH